MADSSNLSSDVLWQIARSQNSYLVKRRSGGEVQFSRDPMNLMNMHSRKYTGLVNDKAVGIQPAEGGGAVLMTKKTQQPNKPASSVATTNYTSTTGPKAYKSIASQVTKRGYRPDLRAESVARASAIFKSQRPKKDTPPKKPRGAKARKAAEKDS